MNYVAVIGDIKNSKKAADRDIVQEKLNCILNEINEKYEKEITAKFLITLGDEFQGLLSSVSNLIDIIELIKRRMYPVELRFGIGIGEITTAINKDAAIGADGPAFYAAREMIETLRNQEKKLKDQSSDIKVSFYGIESLQVDQINVFFRIMRVIEKNWSDEQRKTVMDILEYGGKQTEIAKRLETTQSTIARRLMTSNYLTYKDIEEITKKSFAEIYK